MLNRLRIGCLLLVIHAAVPIAWAGAGGTITLPVPGMAQKVNSGLQMDFFSHWVECPGYRPLEVTVTCLPPAAADRHLHVSVIPQDWENSRQGVEFDIKVPEGATRLTREIAVPQTGVWNQLTIEVREDGRRLDDLSATVAINRAVSSSSWTEAYPSMLFIDSDAPDPIRVNSFGTGTMANDQDLLPNIFAVADLIAPLDDYAQNIRKGPGQQQNSDRKQDRRSDTEILTATQRLQTLALLPPTSLPTQWINYTCLDLIFISLDDVRRMAAENPDKLSAIREYVVRGGNLVVYGVGTDDSGIQQLQRHLRRAADKHITAGRVWEGEAPAGNFQSAARLTSSDGTIKSDWKAPSDESFGPHLSEIGAPSNVVRSYNRNRVAIEEELDDELNNPNWQETRKVPESMFRWRNFGWGRLIALETDKLGDADEDQWAWVLNDIGADRWRWYRRHGLSIARPNRGFWDFLIPGVGAAPVRTFLGVITAFMFVIGPVNYFLLNRSRRLYLLLVTVPLGSAIMIAGLFGYALLKDGLGTRVRLRSFTQILPDGQAVTWSRQSYYSGLAPSSGLIYPTTAAIFPIEFDPNRIARSRRIVQWRDVQQLAPGYLRARTTSQHLVISAAQVDSTVEIERHESSTIKVTNRGSISLDQMLIYDENEAFWLEGLRPGATGPVRALPASEARDLYGQLLRANSPSKPLGFTPPRERNRYRYYNNFDTGFSMPDFNSSLMERRISAPSFGAPPGGRVYFLVTTRAPEFIPLGVEQSRQEAGFHVIQGEW